MKKEEAYHWAAGQVRSKVKKHIDVVATLANTAAILKERLPHFFWVGFYTVKGNDLILGPFQGPPACVMLSLDNGVCAASIGSKKTIIVPNVNEFPGHITCDARSKSEIVVPLFDSTGNLKAVLDVDSDRFNDFDQTDERGLETISQLLTPIWPNN